MIPSTELLLCSPLGFDLATATPVQRARCRIGDGLPLEELRDHPDVVQMVGGPEAVERLPSERGIAPRMVVDLSSIRSAKTMLAVCRAVRAVFAVSTMACRIGEVPRIPLWSLKLSRARVAFRMLSALFKRPALAPLVIGETAEALTVRNPEGVPVEIVCVAGGRSAQDFVGDWLDGMIADEAPRMLGRDDGVVNLSDVLTAVQGRVLTGGQVQLVGSPWAPHGPVYDLVQEHFGQPSEAIVVLRSTGPQNNPAHFRPELCAEMQETDPVAYQTSVLADFADPESGLLSPLPVRTNTRETPLELEPSDAFTYVAAIDPSEGKAGGNGFALCIIGVPRRKAPNGHVRFVVHYVREWRGVDLGGILREIAFVCRRYGVRAVRTDQHAKGALTGYARDVAGLQLHYVPARTLEDWEYVRSQIHTDAVELPPDRQLRADLLGVRKRITQQGATIHLPLTKDGRHADLAAAFCSAMLAAKNPQADFAGIHQTLRGAALPRRFEGSGYARRDPYSDGAARHSGLLMLASDYEQAMDEEDSW